MIKKVVALVSCLTSFFMALEAQNLFDTPHPSLQKEWVDSVFNSLTPDQKIGQLFMVAAYSNKYESYYQDLEALIKNFHVGGLVFFQGGPVIQAHLTNRLQRLAKIPLMIAMDGEWGLGMRLDSTISFPRQMTLGAIQDNSLITQMGKEIASQQIRLGVHVNFAPVVDINSNPGNPVIGDRSFGEDKINVSLKGSAYMRGLQRGGIIATAKHFPGHGDTGKDSHKTLPVIKHSKSRLEEMELYPFRQLIDGGLMGMMIAHIHVPALDKKSKVATSISQSVVTGLLKEEMNFTGLVFSDALNMKGVSQYNKPGELDLMALQAGNDLLVFPENVPEAIKKIKKALLKGKLTQDELDKKIIKILTAKYWLGLNEWKPVNTEHLIGRLNNSEAYALKQRLYEAAITLVQNESGTVPISILDTTYFASLSIGTNNPSVFQLMLENYAPFSHYQIPNQSENNHDQLLEKLSHYKTVVVGIHGMNNSRSRNYGVNPRDLLLLKSLNSKSQLIIVVFGNPYSLRLFEDFSTLICAYQDETMVHQIAAQVIFGALPTTGKLPITSSVKIILGMGITTDPLQRLSYGYPESVGMDSKVLNKIGRIMEEAIENNATPGGQVLVAKSGKIIFQKPYGYFTYDSLTKVTNQSVYDIASVTKVVATLQALMFLEGRGRLELDKKASYYLKELKDSNKASMHMTDILTHQAGLLPFIPFWKFTIDSAGVSPAFYRTQNDSIFSIQVSPGLYGLQTLKDSIWKWTIESKLMPKSKKSNTHEYKYSDMGFYIMQRVAEDLLNQPIEVFLEQNFYSPMGLGSMSYLPLCKYPIHRIVPTEEDRYFRNSVICGLVHDPVAAMYGGIAGHAGVFSNSNDLAKLLQMNLQDGYYGGIVYLKKGTINKFTDKQFPNNRRALGWDKPLIGEFGGPTSRFATAATYGHTGFTGTAVWVDPEFDLIYIFLSNRTYPRGKNFQLIESNIRTRIQDLIYESIWSYESIHF